MRGDTASAARVWKEGVLAARTGAGRYRWRMRCRRGSEVRVLGVWGGVWKKPV
jgi:hypothetical protein